MRWWHVALGGVAALAGCEEKPRPWSRGDGPPAVLAPTPGQSTGTAGTGGGGTTGSEGGTPGYPTPNSSSNSSPSPSSSSSGATTGGEAAGAPGPATSADAGPAAAAGTPPGERGRVTPGGTWVSCHEGLPLSGDPLRDVTRLGLLCGPSNGMRRASRQAIVGLVGEHEPAVTSTFEAKRGACYRVLAAADPQVADLDVTIRSSRDVGVAGDHGKGRLAIVQPDRPFCTFSDETFTVEIAARRGSGRFAAEVWAIGEPLKRRDLMELPPDEPPIDKP